MKALNVVTVGSVWMPSDNSRSVKVREIEERDDGIWIQYGRHGEDRTYECLVDAFKHRFIKQING